LVNTKTKEVEKKMIKVNEKVKINNPGLVIGVVKVKGLDNSGSESEIQSMIADVQSEIRKKYSKETLAEVPKIKVWREAYIRFGAKPKTYKPSVEALYRMTLDGIPVRPINKVVDIYNYISLKHMVPVGGDDLDHVDGDIELTYAKGDEKFELLGSKELQNPEKGEVIYKDDKEVLCRRWNWRECDKSKMTQDTKNVSLVIEGLPPVTKGEMEQIANELGEIVLHLLLHRLESLLPGQRRFIDLGEAAVKSSLTIAGAPIHLVGANS